jgi:hypothetical protein
MEFKNSLEIIQEIETHLFENHDDKFEVVVGKPTPPEIMDHPGWNFPSAIMNVVRLDSDTIAAEIICESRNYVYGYTQWRVFFHGHHKSEETLPRQIQGVLRKFAKHFDGDF